MKADLSWGGGYTKLLLCSCRAADGPSNSENELLQDCRFLQFKTTLTGGRKAIVLFDLVEFGVLILEKEATAGRSSASEQTPVRWHAIRWNEESRRESNEL